MGVRPRMAPSAGLDDESDEAGKRGWLVVDMKTDWKVIWRE